MSTVRATVRRIMEDFGPDYWRELDAQRAFPQPFFEAMGKAGFFGTLLPVEHGGSGAGPAAAAAIVEEINRAGGDAAAINAQMAICGAILRGGSDAQKARYLPAVARGELRCLAVAATEPDGGADMSALESTAERQADGSWLLKAHKVFISMVEHTDLLVLLTRTDQGPGLFLIDRREHGEALEVRPLELIANRMTTTLFVDGLRVPDEMRLGEPGSGLTTLMGGFAVRRVLAACESIGNARFLLDRALEHARTREVFGRIIGQNQGVQYPLAQAYARVEAADLMRADALRLIEAGEDAGGRSALAKVLASEAAWETARAALTSFGGWGLASEMHVERKLRECTVFIFNNLLMSMISQRVLGLPKGF